MKLEVLLSCMNETADIFHKSGLDNVPALAINQCGAETEEMVAVDALHRMFQTTSRGLSVSRNYGLQFADGAFCLLADDDEVFEPFVSDRICKAYEETPEADLIVFQVREEDVRLGDQKRKLGLFDLLRVASVQISFRPDAIRKAGIRFDPLLGAGTPNGAGEETKFLFDCYRHGLSIWFVPQKVASLDADSASTWFDGYNEAFFYKRGSVTRYIMGFPLSLLYACYFLVFKYRLYRQDISPLMAAKQLFAGLFHNDLRREKTRLIQEDAK